MRQTCSELQVLVACGTLTIDAARCRAAQTLTSDRHLLVVGIAHAAVANCWYLGLARPGAALTWISVHRSKREVEHQVDLVVRAAQVGTCRTRAPGSTCCTTWRRTVRRSGVRLRQRRRSSGAAGHRPTGAIQDVRRMMDPARRDAAHRAAGQGLRADVARSGR